MPRSSTARRSWCKDHSIKWRSFVRFACDPRIPGAQNHHATLSNTQNEAPSTRLQPHLAGTGRVPQDRTERRSRRRSRPEIHNNICSHCRALKHHHKRANHLHQSRHLRRASLHPRAQRAVDGAGIHHGRFQVRQEPGHDRCF